MKIGDRVQRVPETFGETEEIRDGTGKERHADAPTTERLYTSIRWGGSMWWLLRHGGGTIRESFAGV